MIRHNPCGLEHPYTATYDQRVPCWPSDGDAVEVRVRASNGTQTVRCEWETRDTTGRKTTWLDLTPADPGASANPDAPESGAESGHLSEIQERGITAKHAWRVDCGTVHHGARYRYRFHATSSSGREERSRWYEFRAGSWADQGGTLDVSGTSRLLDDSVRWWRDGEGRVTKVRFALPLRRDDHVVGFGERFEALDQRGRSLDARVFEQYKGQGRAGRTYLPMPFAHVVSPTEANWGFFLETSTRSWYDVGRQEPDRIQVTCELDPREPSLAVRFFDGAPTEVLGRFLDVAGRAQPLPDWVFRLWGSDNEWNSQARIEQELEQHRATGIDIGVVVIEAWSDESTFAAFGGAQFTPVPDGGAHSLADFTFPAGSPWPDPRGFVAELHRDGVRVVLWQIPLMKMLPAPRGQLGEDVRHATQKGFLIEEPDGRPYRNRGPWFNRALMPDLRDAQVAQWWTDRLRYLVSEVGIDGFKTDGGEHAWGDQLQYRDGSAGVTGNNEFPVAYARAFGRLLESEGKAPVTFSRAGFTGSQGVGIIWAGDEDSTWEAYRNSLIAGVTAASCGIVYWAWDVAGFSGPVPSVELYLRAAAASVFVPIMQYHAEFNFHRADSRARTPWNVARVHGSATVIEDFRGLVELRQRLIPYLAEQAEIACRTDRPLMRALFFDYPRDPRIWDYPSQFLLGDELLVSPVVEEGARVWETYLPELTGGKWIDVWTGESVTGGQVVTSDVTELTHIPVFARDTAWWRLESAFHPNW